MEVRAAQVRSAEINLATIKPQTGVAEKTAPSKHSEHGLDVGSSCP